MEVSLLSLLMEECVFSLFPQMCEGDFGEKLGVGAGFGNQFIFGYEVEVELPIQLENGNEVEYE